MYTHQLTTEHVIYICYMLDIIKRLSFTFLNNIIVNCFVFKLVCAFILKRRGILQRQDICVLTSHWIIDEGLAILFGYKV